MQRNTSESKQHVEQISGGNPQHGHSEIRFDARPTGKPPLRTEADPERPVQVRAEKSVRGMGREDREKQKQKDQTFFHFRPS